MKPMLKAPGTKRLKLKCDVLLSISAFIFNLRRYLMVDDHVPNVRCELAKVGQCSLSG